MKHRDMLIYIYTKDTIYIILRVQVHDSLNRPFQNRLSHFTSLPLKRQHVYMAEGGLMPLAEL